MYLTNNVGGWSTTRISGFYSGRHHSTVLQAIAKVERLSGTDESIDALIEVLTAAVSPKVGEGMAERYPSRDPSVLIEAIAARVIDRVLEFNPSIFSGAEAASRDSRR
jgi:hypothetical protein